ncbi:sensor histidine kinase [Microvirga massiliensis]|uniref:sensor histidine kinase n=1 Tax=Microvirga massiliensis TaxID=1033741 RepID=UPI00062BD460|nr:sensor histidine kinase [Microvirga massiliensis]
MRRGSLKRRLLAAAASSIVLALVIAGIGLLLLFERHVERRMTSELQIYLDQIVSGIDRTQDGALQVVSEPAEPRFLEPLSGLYWQVAAEPDGPVLRSRSLWDETLALPADTLLDGEVHEHVIPGPAKSSLLVVEREVQLPERLGDRRIRAAVAIDRSEIHAAGRDFALDLVPSLALLAAILVAAAWVQVTVGLRPLDTVRRRLAAVRAGRATRLGTNFPDEVHPLAAEVDHLLDAQEKALERARARAADLAHGLKTPLTVLTSDAAELRARGEEQIADEIAAVTDGMRRHVERELARARAGARIHPRASHPLRPVVDQVVGVLRRTPRGHDLDWDVIVPEGISTRVDAQDLAEMLGNLAENAVKWAVRKIRITGWWTDTNLVLSVEDDGPGIPGSEAAAALARGQRLDESQPGSGLGLAIVSDLVETCGGSLSLGRSELGGLLAELHLPDSPRSVL